MAGQQADWLVEHIHEVPALVVPCVAFGEGVARVYAEAGRDARRATSVGIIQAATCGQHPPGDAAVPPRRARTRPWVLLDRGPPVLRGGRRVGAWRALRDRSAGGPDPGRARERRRVPRRAAPAAVGRGALGRLVGGRPRQSRALDEVSSGVATSRSVRRIAAAGSVRVLRAGAGLAPPGAASRGGAGWGRCDPTLRGKPNLCSVDRRTRAGPARESLRIDTSPGGRTDERRRRRPTVRSSSPMSRPGESGTQRRSPRISPAMGFGGGRSSCRFPSVARTAFTAPRRSPSRSGRFSPPFPIWSWRFASSSRPTRARYWNGSTPVLTPGAWNRLTPQGEHIEFSGVAVYKVTDGKIAEERLYFDPNLLIREWAVPLGTLMSVGMTTWKQSRATRKTRKAAERS